MPSDGRVIKVVQAVVHHVVLDGGVVITAGVDPVTIVGVPVPDARVIVAAGMKRGEYHGETWRMCRLL